MQQVGEKDACKETEPALPYEKIELQAVTEIVKEPQA